MAIQHIIISDAYSTIPPLHLEATFWLWMGFGPDLPTSRTARSDEDTVKQA
jgi:hypothetical protein